MTDDVNWAAWSWLFVVAVGMTLYVIGPPVWAFVRDLAGHLLWKWRSRAGGLRSARREGLLRLGDLIEGEGRR